MSHNQPSPTTTERRIKTNNRGDSSNKPRGLRYSLVGEGKLKQ